MSKVNKSLLARQFRATQADVLGESAECPGVSILSQAFASTAPAFANQAFAVRNISNVAFNYNLG